jgi:hypothetical protein
MPKWFTVATEGQTTDGRVIERAWLEQIAETYNRKTYGARVSIEHQLSIYPGSVFRAYGDVTAAQTVEVDGKLQLQVQIDPTPELVELTKSRQKIYTSIEVNPNFAKTGKAYLTGLAVTDTPASLGTDVLAFCAQHPDKHPLALRKTSAECLFSSALETALDFGDKADDEAPKLFQRVRDILARNRAGDATQFKQVDEAVTELAQHFTSALTAAEQQIGELTKRLDEFATGYVKAEAFNELKALLDKTPRQFTQRQPATGADDTMRADC